MKIVLPLSLLLLGLGGCSDRTGGYPSLRPRASETIETKSAPVAEPVALASVTAGLEDQLGVILADTRRTDAEFGKLASQTWPIVQRAHGAAKGSDAWVTAQMAISRLEAARTPVKRALIDLDEKRRLALFAPPSQDRLVVESAVRNVEEMDAAQHAVVQQMISQLAK